ncbi:MAG: polysaccharide biosynthesis/export family protein, partial [Pyrinomonadaceae bacterium]
VETVPLDVPENNHRPEVTAEAGAAKPEAPPAAKTTKPDAAVDPTSVYRVGVGDVLDVRLLDAPAGPSSLFTVSAGGLLEYPLAGNPLRVAGMTCDEIRDILTAELKRRAIDQNPELAVGVREYVSHNVIVSGLVAEPGTKVLRREAVPLYVLIAEAQPRPEAGQVRIVSHAAGRTTTAGILDHAAMNTLVYPGDVLTVEARPAQFFYIGGAVETPGQKDFQPGMTLTQGILKAGGNLSAGGEVKIMRQGEDGLLATTSYRLKEIVAGKMPDPLLRPDDRIEVER